MPRKALNRHVKHKRKRHLAVQHSAQGRTVAADVVEVVTKINEAGLYWPLPVILHNDWKKEFDAWSGEPGKAPIRLHNGKTITYCKLKDGEKRVWPASNKELNFYGKRAREEVPDSESRTLRRVVKKRTFWTVDHRVQGTTSTDDVLECVTKINEGAYYFPRPLLLHCDWQRTFNNSEGPNSRGLVHLADGRKIAFQDLRSGGVRLWEPSIRTVRMWRANRSRTMFYQPAMEEGKRTTGLKLQLELDRNAATNPLYVDHEMLGVGSFEDVLEVVTKLNEKAVYAQPVLLHKTARELFENCRGQSPSLRPVVLSCGRTVCYRLLRFGNCRLFARTEKEAAALKLRKSEHRSLLYKRFGSPLISEAEAVQWFARQTQDVLDVFPLSDGLRADFLVRIKGDPDSLGWVGVQAKSARSFLSTERRPILDFGSVSRNDAAPGGRYEDLVILGAAHAPMTDDEIATLRKAQTGFDEVGARNVKFLFLLPSALFLPKRHFVVYMTRSSAQWHPYQVRIEDRGRIQEMQKVVDVVRGAKRFSLENIWFSTNHVSPTMAKEVRNLERLFRILPPEFKMCGPKRQNETVDIVIKTDQHLDMCVSAKTLTRYGQRLTFDLGASPRKEHCDVVLAFDGDDLYPIRSHIVYSDSGPKTRFAFSPTKNTFIFKDRCRVTEREGIQKFVRLLLQFAAHKRRSIAN